MLSSKCHLEYLSERQTAAAGCSPSKKPQATGGRGGRIFREHSVWVCGRQVFELSYHGKGVWLEAWGRREQLPDFICRICSTPRLENILLLQNCSNPSTVRKITSSHPCHIYSSFVPEARIHLHVWKMTVEQLHPLPGNGGFAFATSFRTSR